MKKEIAIFSTQKNKPLTLKELQIAIKMLDDKISTPVLDHISHNSNKFVRVFKKMAGKKAIKINAINVLYGFPVRKISWIPDGEIWLQDKDGKILKKFSLI